MDAAESSHRLAEPPVLSPRTVTAQLDNQQPIRIVVPVDGSERSEQALGVAQSLAALLHGPIELLHVTDTDHSRGQAEEYLRGIVDHFLTGHPVQTCVLQGDPVEEILRYLTGASATIVAMSTHGRSGLQRLFLGSVADTVIRHVGIPVVVVRDGKPLASDIRHLLVPLDGSDYAAGALPLATSLANDDRTLGLVRVLDLSHPRENVIIKYGSVWSDTDLIEEITVEIERDARACLDEVAVRLRAAGFRATWEIRVGRPCDEIIRAAETTGTDLIVMATHGLGGMRRLAFGSVTDEVIRHSSIPVLVIPPHGI